MTDRQKSWAAYGLAALAILCATILGALRVMDASVVVAVFGLALSGVGWYHASAPGQAALATSLSILLLGTSGCYNGGVPFFFIGGSPQKAAPLATSITPITVLTGGASGFSYSGESYDVACTVSGTVTLYPAVYNGAAWEVYQDFAYALDASVATQATVTMPARTGTGLTWNAYKTGTGSVTGCAASGRSGPAPSRRTSGGSGTITSLSAGAGITLTPNPITATGTIAVSATGLGPQIVCTPNTGLGSATPIFPQDPANGSGTVGLAMWRVYAPAASTWRVRAAVSTALAVNRNYTVEIFAATTVNGTYGAVSGSALTVTTSSGTAISTGSTVTPSASADRWLTIRFTYNQDAPLLDANSYIGILERVS